MKKKTAQKPKPHKKTRLSILRITVVGIILVTLGMFSWHNLVSPKDRHCSTQKEISSVPPETINTEFEYFQRGDYYFEQGDCTRALANYTYSIGLKPTAEAYNNRAYTYMRLQDYIHALSDLDMAIKLRPNYSTALANRGDIHLFYYAKDLRRAIADYDQAIKAQQPITNTICGHRAIAIAKLTKPFGWNIFTYLSLRAKPKNFGCTIPTPL